MSIPFLNSASSSPLERELQQEEQNYHDALQRDVAFAVLKEIKNKIKVLKQLQEEEAKTKDPKKM